MQNSAWGGFALNFIALPLYVVVAMLRLLRVEH